MDHSRHLTQNHPLPQANNGMHSQGPQDLVFMGAIHCHLHLWPIHTSKCTTQSDILWSSPKPHSKTGGSDWSFSPASLGENRKFSKSMTQLSGNTLSRLLNLSWLTATED